MNYRLSVTPAMENSIRFKVFLFESRMEALAAKNTVADMLLFLQDDLKVMPDYSNIITAEERIDGEWEEIKECRRTSQDMHAELLAKIEAGEEMKVEININEYVTCELTDFGMRQIKKRGHKPEIIKDNLIRIQLWELMNTLGDSMFNGSEQSIYMNKITLCQ